MKEAKQFAFRESSQTKKQNLICFTSLSVMNFLGILGFLFLGTGLLVPTLVRVAMQECTKYEVPALSPDNIIFITGANSGLGYHTALSLAKAGAHVVMGCRSSKNCAEAKRSIITEVPSAVVDIMTLDLSSFDSIHAFAKEFRSKYDHLNVLVNNAGIMAVPTREVTKDGLESQMGTNHFGHFLLTSLLMPMISKNGRIVNHSSGAHLAAASNFVFNDLLSEKSYDPWVAYGNSKSANLLFTYELNNRLVRSKDDRNIISVAVHPGYTSTNLQADKIPFWEHMNAIFAMHGHDGALSQIEAAVGVNVKASDKNYIGPRYIMFGAPHVQGTSKATWDADAQRKLWEESVRITGETFGGAVIT